MSIEAYESAVGFLRDVLGQYDVINLDFIRLSDAWRQLDFRSRVELGDKHPHLVEALLKIENHVN